MSACPEGQQAITGAGMATRGTGMAIRGRRNNEKSSLSPELMICFQRECILETEMDMMFSFNSQTVGDSLQEVLAQ